MGSKKGWIALTLLLAGCANVSPWEADKEAIKQARLALDAELGGSHEVSGAFVGLSQDGRVTVCGTTLALGEQRTFTVQLGDTPSVRLAAFAGSPLEERECNDEARGRFTDTAFKDPAKITRMIRG